MYYITMQTETPTRVATIFNGTYTISGPNGHRTFAVKTVPTDSTFAPGKRVIAILDGPDNQNDYRPFGFVDDEGMREWVVAHFDGCDYGKVEVVSVEVVQ